VLELLGLELLELLELLGLELLGLELLELWKLLGWFLDLISSAFLPAKGICPAN
jgi:hypothetical protein